MLTASQLGTFGQFDGNDDTPEYSAGGGTSYDTVDPPGSAKEVDFSGAAGGIAAV